MDRIEKLLEAMGIPIESIKNILSALDTQSQRLEMLGDEIEKLIAMEALPHAKLICLAQLLNDAMHKKILLVECDTCLGTGIFMGSGRPKSDGVVCRKCIRGCRILIYTPYVIQGKWAGVETVYPHYDFGKPEPGPDQAIGYDEYLAGAMPGEDGKAKQ